MIRKNRSDTLTPGYGLLLTHEHFNLGRLTHNIKIASDFVFKGTKVEFAVGQPTTQDDDVTETKGTKKGAAAAISAKSMMAVNVFS